MKSGESEFVDPGNDDKIFGSRRLSWLLNPASLSFALIGLLITTFAASALYQAQKETLGTKFNSDTENIHRLLKARIDRGVRLVQAGGAFLRATGGVDDTQWTDFLHGLELETDFPGLQGVGHAGIAGGAVPSSPKTPEEQGVRDPPRSSAKMGDSCFAPILLYEALSAADNDLALGGDLASNLTRVEAIAVARDSGECAICVDPAPRGTGEPTFFFCLPLYAGGADLTSIALRRKAIQGFVFASFDVAGLVEDIFVGAEGHIGLRIVDQNDSPGSTPIYSTSATNLSPIFQSASELHVGGRFWRVETFSLAAFENRKTRLSSLFIALSGIAITLLGMMILSDSRAKQEKAARIAQHSAESLMESEAEIREMNIGLEKAVAIRTARLAEANEELKAFSYTVSHDLRAPVRHVEALAGFMIEEHGAELSPGAIDYLARISESAARMQSLIEDILKLASCSSAAFHPRRVDLSALATELASTFGCLHQSRIIQVEIEPGLEITGDPAVIRTTMQNLLDNAFKFTVRREIATISIGSLMREGKRFYYVRDNGTGFDMQQAETIFQPFKRLHRQSDFEGSGVGLATVRKMIRRHGGEIFVHSVPGIGTTFYFQLDADEGGYTKDGESEVLHHPVPLSPKGTAPLRDEPARAVDSSSHGNGS